MKRMHGLKAVEAFHERQGSVQNKLLCRNPGGAWKLGSFDALLRPDPRVGRQLRACINPRPNQYSQLKPE